MLPKNRLRNYRLGRLFIFPDAEHPYDKNIVKRFDEKIEALQKKE
jgi:large subunit ribosomal protein L13